MARADHINGETQLQFVQRRVPPVMKAHTDGTLKRRLNRELIAVLSDLHETDTVRLYALSARMQLDDAMIEARRVGDMESVQALRAAMNAVNEACGVRFKVAGGADAYFERSEGPRGSV